MEFHSKNQNQYKIIEPLIQIKPIVPLTPAYLVASASALLYMQPQVKLPWEKVDDALNYIPK